MTEIPPRSDSSEAAPTDLALVGQIIARRPEALAQLHTRYGSTLLAVTRRILSGAPEAEDVLQETFLHVWNQAARYDPRRSSVATWLVLIARSRAIDRLRSLKVVARSHEAAQLESPPAHTSPDGVEAVFIGERRDRVRQALAKLPAEQRQVLEMAFYEGLTQTEIAAKAGLALGTVKTRTLLAMKKLRAELRDEIGQLL